MDIQLKPAVRQLSCDSNFSLNIKVDSGSNLSTACHYHPQVELILIRNSGGTRIIGTSIEPFTHHDLLLIGKNLPHAFVHEERPLHDDTAPLPEAMIIQFYETFLGKEFLALPELKEIQQLFLMAQQGLCIREDGKKMIIPLIEKMTQATSLGRILILLEILRILVNRDMYRLLVNTGFILHAAVEDDRRINKIMDFTSENYCQNIKIEEVAEIVNLTRESFCRYFKAQTRKTYLEFLIEFRINKACQMIMENKLSIKEIGYSCGFDSLSNFHHQFKKIIKQSPLEFKYLTLNRRTA